LGTSANGATAVIAPSPADQALPIPSPARQVATGGMWTALTWLLTLATGPAITVVLVRSMSARAFGEFALAASSIGVLAILSAFGLEPTIARFASTAMALGEQRDALPTYRAGIRLARWAATAAGFVIAALALTSRSFLVLHPVVPALLASAPVALLAPFKGVYGGMLRAMHRPKTVSVATVGSSVVFAVAVVSVAVAGSVTAPIAATALSLEALVCTVVRRRGVPTSIRATGRRTGAGSSDLAPIIGFATATVLTGVFAVAVSDLDVVFLGLIHGTRAVAAYAPVSMVANGAMGLPAIVGAFFLPAAARVVATGDRADLASLYHWASRWSLVICAPVLGVMIACPESVVAVLFGAHHASDAVALRVLGVGAASQVLFGFNGLTLDAHGLAAVVAKRQAISVAVSVAMCAALVPRFGALGAAWATTGSLVISNVLCSRSLWMRFSIAPWDRGLAWLASTVAVAAAIDSLVLRSLGDPWLRCAVSAGFIGGAALFAAICVAERQERRSIWYFLKSVLSWPVATWARYGQ
jgi:O-antigen/teichoic acid export membrane protein